MGLVRCRVVFDTTVIHARISCSFNQRHPESIFFDILSKPILVIAAPQRYRYQRPVGNSDGQ
jgi:hypothetical protein